MKKVIATLLLVTLLGGLFLFGTNKASAEGSSVFRLYPLSEDNLMNENKVAFGSLGFGRQTSYIDKKGVKRIHTHNGVDIMAGSTTKVYPYKDTDAYVVRNNTGPKYGRKYGTAFDTYWNSFLVIYYPSLQLYVYYGHIISDLAPNSKIDINKPLGTIRESYNDKGARTKAGDHLHLSVSAKDVATGWGYSEGALSKDDVLRQGWLDPIEFMRGKQDALSGDNIILSFNPDANQAAELYLCCYEKNSYIVSKANGGNKISCYVLNVDGFYDDGYIYSILFFLSGYNSQNHRPIISSVEKHELLISNNTPVYLYDDCGSSIRFDDYLANGYHFNDPFHWWPYSFYATIRNNEITALYEIRANDQWYSE